MTMISLKTNSFITLVMGTVLILSVGIPSHADEFNVDWPDTEVVWEKDFHQDEIYSIPKPVPFADGKYLLLIIGSKVIAVDEVGKVVWEHTIWIRGEPIVTMDEIVLISTLGLVYFLDFKGNITKSVEFLGRCNGASRVNGDHILIPTTHGLHVMELESGQYTTILKNTNIISKPNLDSDLNIYLVDSEYRLWSFDQNGIFRWQRNLNPSREKLSFVVQGQELYEKLLLIEDKYYSSLELPTSTIEVSRVNDIYVVSRYASLHCFDSDGDLKWIFVAASNVFGEWNLRWGWDEFTTEFRLKVIVSSQVRSFVLGSDGKIIYEWPEGPAFVRNLEYSNNLGLLTSYRDQSFALAQYNGDIFTSRFESDFGFVEIFSINYNLVIILTSSGKALLLSIGESIERDYGFYWR